ncbi:MAG UNVERIFIED_CONTAM: hypothetical protein LVR18_51175 [Planctomycetaceae bacterium]|jgi:xanthine/uracil/vitamin C permease (AzgA family)
MSKDRRIDIEDINGVTVARLLEKKILDEANIEALGQELLRSSIRTVVGRSFSTSPTSSTSPARLWASSSRCTRR